MDPKQGNQEGSNYMFVPMLIFKSGNFSREILPEMAVEDLILGQKD